MKKIEFIIILFLLLGITLSMIIIPSIKYNYLETYTTNSMLGGKLTALQTYLDNLNEAMTKIVSNFKSIYMNNDDFSKPGTLIYNLYQDMINIKPIANAINNTLQITTEKDPKLVDQQVITSDYRWIDIQQSTFMLKKVLNSLQMNITKYLEMVPDPIPSSYTNLQRETIPLLNDLKVDINIIDSRINDLLKS
jgi:hypothetical protein